ncbi:TM2 domain-containing protein [Gemelliphila palaticanis]|uniref:TM2 domain-containing protein n=1 Tax=Gemelliphila palaticanis TaxID=81950 RepID=A0ABX2T0D4_9BACL|nr:TM2 domain-containing protein [Gemella palaticanis]MBF0714730.1 TM2 domain-containing protein [Gemella palaticanis]NYS46660.1 TM2 domain-containing protein [Gemella palaticanis]
MNNFTETYLMTHAKYFPQEKIFLVKERLDLVPENEQMYIHSIGLKNPLLMLLISWFGGVFGIDRFMLGQVLLGILKLITLGGCGLWAIIDLFLIMGETREYNFKKLINM